MTNNVVFIIVLTCVFLPNYAGAQVGYSSSSRNSGGNQDARYSNINPTTGIVMVVLVCAFFLMGFLSIYIRQCSEVTLATDSSYTARIARLGTASGGHCCRRQGLDPALVDSFPVLAYISLKELKNGKASGALECAVCLSEFEEFDSLKLLPKCNHVFHPECIEAWLASHVTCPVCRANLEVKLDPNSCPQCGIVNNSSSSRNDDNLVTNSVPGESNLEQQQHQQPQASVSVVVNSENREEEENDDHERGRILGKLMRSHSTGHSLPLQEVNMERHTPRLPEEGGISTGYEKVCLRKCSSYEVILDLGTSSNSSSSSSSSGGKSGDFVGSQPCGGGSGLRFFTSVKVPFSFLGLKVDEEEQWRNRPPV